MKIKLTRTHRTTKETWGTLVVMDWKYSKHVFYTLELPALDNKTDVSRIPAKIYHCKKGDSPSFPYTVIHILDVVDREGIRLHAANYYTQLKGCIAVGSKLLDINRDGQLDVVNSMRAFENLMSLLPDEFDLEIVDEDVFVNDPLETKGNEK